MFFSFSRFCSQADRGCACVMCCCRVIVVVRDPPHTHTHSSAPPLPTHPPLMHEAFTLSQRFPLVPVVCLPQFRTDSLVAPTTLKTVNRPVASKEQKEGENKHKLILSKKLHQTAQSHLTFCLLTLRFLCLQEKIVNSGKSAEVLNVSKEDESWWQNVLPFSSKFPKRLSTLISHVMFARLVACLTHLHGGVIEEWFTPSVWFVSGCAHNKSGGHKMLWFVLCSSFTSKTASSTSGSWWWVTSPHRHPILRKAKTWIFQATRIICSFCWQTCQPTLTPN